MFGFTMRQTRNRIAKGILGEIAGAHGQRRHQAGKGNFVELIFLFAIDEEEGLVLLNGAANSTAKLVQVELFDGVGKVALGIESLIAQKLEQSPVKVVGSRLLW